MSKVVDLRNTSTHFVTTEYEIFFGPILQSCVTNYADKLLFLHGINIANTMPENYLNLAVCRGVVSEEAVRAKYEPEVAAKLLEQYNNIALDAEDGNQRYAAYYRTELAIVRDPKKADLAVRLVPEAEAGIAIAKEIKELKQKYIYTYKMACEAIDKKIKKEGLTVTFNGRVVDRFNTYHFQLFVSFYEMKDKECFAYDTAVANKQPSYGYSQQAVDFVVENLRRDQDALTGIKHNLPKKV